MTYTTNMSTGGSPVTYSILAKDCGELAALARNMEVIAKQKSDFRDDPEFHRLRTEFKATWDRIYSLDIAI